MTFKQKVDEAFERIGVEWSRNVDLLGDELASVWEKFSFSDLLTPPLRYYSDPNPQLSYLISQFDAVVGAFTNFAQRLAQTPARVAAFELVQSFPTPKKAGQKVMTVAAAQRLVAEQIVELGFDVASGNLPASWRLYKRLEHGATVWRLLRTWEASAALSLLKTRVVGFITAFAVGVVGVIVSIAVLAMLWLWSEKVNNAAQQRALEETALPQDSSLVFTGRRKFWHRVNLRTGKDS